MRLIKDACLEIRVLLAEGDGIESVTTTDIEHGPGIPKPGVPGNLADNMLQLPPDTPLCDRPEMVMSRPEAGLLRLHAVLERFSQV